jgi:hypothetical protein
MYRDRYIYTYIGQRKRGEEENTRISRVSTGTTVVQYRTAQKAYLPPSKIQHKIRSYWY